MDSRSIFIAGGHQLIRRDSQVLELDARLLRAAREELLRRRALGGVRWGYLLGVEGDAAMPAARELAERLHDAVARPVGGCRGADFALSFLKAADGRPPRASEGVHYGGYHVDTHADERPGAELLRVLVNLGPQPRFVRYAPIVVRNRARYRVGELPGLPDRTVAIPGLDGCVVSYLTFWASMVPHVGVDTPAGYYLASFEAVMVGDESPDSSDG